MDDHVMISGPDVPSFESPSSKVTINGHSLKCDSYYYGNDGHSVTTSTKVHKGTWVYEIDPNIRGNIRIGWATNQFSGSEAGAGVDSWVLRLHDGNLMHNHSDNKGTSWVSADQLQGKTISAVLDIDNCTISFYANGNLLNNRPAFTSVKATSFTPVIHLGSSSSCNLNFSRKLAYPIAGACPLNIQINDQQRDKIEAMWSRYHSDSVSLSDSGDRGTIKSQGILNLSKDVNGSEEGMELTLAVMAWKFRAGTLWEFTHAEWLQAMSLYAIYDIETFQATAKKWIEELKIPHIFKAFYGFLFTFLLSPGRYVLDVNEALETWNVLDFPQKYPELWPKWQSFISAKQTISKDAWQMLPLFLTTVGVDMSGFDEGACWPVILEDFAYYCKDNS